LTNELISLKKELRRRQKLGHIAAVENLKEEIMKLQTQNKKNFDCNTCTLLETKTRINSFGKTENFHFCPVFKQEITLQKGFAVRHDIYNDFYFVTPVVYNCPNHPNYAQDSIKQLNKTKNTWRNNIRVDCYISVFRKFKEEYHDAHFELITRKHIKMDYSTYSDYLAPSKELLDETKATKMSFEDYTNRFINEIKNSERAKERIKILRNAAKRGKTIFLVCFEKDPETCHRSIVKKIVTGEIEL